MLSLLQVLGVTDGRHFGILVCFCDVNSSCFEQVVDWIQKEGWCVSELWSLVQEYGRCRINRQVKSELYEWILPRDSKGLFPH